MQADKAKISRLLKTARGQIDGILTVSYTHLTLPTT